MSQIVILYDTRMNCVPLTMWGVGPETSYHKVLIRRTNVISFPSSNHLLPSHSITMDIFILIIIMWGVCCVFYHKFLQVNEVKDIFVDLCCRQMCVCMVKLPFSRRKKLLRDNFRAIFWIYMWILYNLTCPKKKMMTERSILMSMSTDCARECFQR